MGPSVTVLAAPDVSGRAVTLPQASPVGLGSERGGGTDRLAGQRLLLLTESAREALRALLSFPSHGLSRGAGGRVSPQRERQTRASHALPFVSIQVSPSVFTCFIQ